VLTYDIAGLEDLIAGLQRAQQLAGVMAAEIETNANG
jgi:hypothetical protein